MAKKYSREQIINKVKKLMAVALSDVESVKDAEQRATLQAQIDNAAGLAAKLMTEHQLTEAEINNGTEKKAPKEIEVWRFQVNNKNFAGLMRRDSLAWIGEAFGARALSSTLHTRGGNTKGFSLSFWATADVLDTLKIVIPALALSAESRVQAEVAEKRAELRSNPWYTSRDVTREADRFVKGWWHAYGSAASSKVRAMRKQAVQEYDGNGSGELVLQSEADRINAHLNNIFKKIGKASGSRTAYSADAILQGRQAGREALVGQAEVSEEARAALN